MVDLTLHKNVWNGKLSMLQNIGKRSAITQKYIQKQVCQKDFIINFEEVGWQLTGMLQK